VVLVGRLFAKLWSMKRRTIIQGASCVLAIVVLSVVAVAHESTGSNQARAIALWEEVIKAKGGRERLHSIESFLVSSTIDVKAPGVVESTETRRLYVLPNRAWLYAGSPHFKTSVEATVDIGRNLCRVTISPKQSDPGLSPCAITTWGAHLSQDPLMYLLETRWMQPKPISTRVERIGSKQVDVIEAEINDLRVDFYLDRTTRLPLKLVTNPFRKSQSEAQLMVTFTFKDYANFSGIQMPRTVIRESAARPTIFTHDIEDARYSFNVEYDKSIFDRLLQRTVP
jgi:hypothetical protein